MVRHLLSLADLEQSDFLHLIARSAEMGSRPELIRNCLSGRSIGILFRKPSTRTRTSFAVATVRLGGIPIVYGPHDLQTNTGEAIEDTVRVLACYLDGLVVRTAGEPEELRVMATIDRLPIINAMTADEHPTQAISDLATLLRRFGRLEGLTLLYLGEGNNTAAALALAASRVKGLELLLITPRGYGLSDSIVVQAHELGRRFGGRVEERHDFPADIPLADAVYTTRWQTTGTFKSDPLWRERFGPLRVTAALMAAMSKRSGTVFMHDLPAVRGEDCDAAVLDGPQSIAFEQAGQKLFTAIAILEWCVAIDW